MSATDGLSLSATTATSDTVAKSAAAVQRCLGAKRGPPMPLPAAERKTLLKVPRKERNSKNNQIMVFDSGFNGLQGAVDGCEAELLMVLREVAKIPRESAQPDTSRKATQHIESTYDMYLGGVWRLENPKLDAASRAFRELHGLSEDFFWSYHGTDKDSVDLIAEHGFEIGDRHAHGYGIYTTQQYLEALAYSPPSRNGSQYFIVSEVYGADRVVIGARADKNFGYDRDNKRIFMAQDPSEKMCIASNPAQLVPRYVVCVVDKLAFHGDVAPTAHNIRSRPFHPQVFHTIYARHFKAMLQIAPPSDMPHMLAAANKAGTWWNHALEKELESLKAAGRAPLSFGGVPLTMPADLLNLPADAAALLAASGPHSLPPRSAPAPKPTVVEAARSAAAANSKAASRKSFDIAASAVAKRDTRGMVTEQVDAHAKMRTALFEAALALSSADINFAQGGELAVRYAANFLKEVKQLARILASASPPRVCLSYKNVCPGDVVELHTLSSKMREYVGLKGAVARITQYGEGARYMCEVELSGDADFQSRLKDMNMQHSLRNKEHTAENPHHIVVTFSQIASPSKPAAAAGP